MRRKYLVFLLIPLIIAVAGCGKKKHYVAPPPPPPELYAPYNLTATAVNYKQINLSWQDSSTIEDGFRVCCDMGGNQYQTVDTLPTNTTSFQHYNLQPMTKYTYYVQAYRGNEYANSKEVSATTSCPVEILDSELHQSPGFKEYYWIMKVGGKVQNNASEPCQAKITAHFGGYPTLTGGKTTVEIKALGTAYFIIEATIDFECESYTVEVTNVEIHY